MAGEPHTRSTVLPLTLAALLTLLGAYLVPAYAGSLIPAPVPSGSAALQAFFTTPSLTYPDQPAMRRSSRLLGAVLADVDAARRRVDVASFDFDLPAVTDALLRAVGRGVQVRAVIDSENLLDPAASAEAGRLERAGVMIGFDRREPFMHDKFLVVDGRVTWIGSWNITDNDTYRNNNNMVRVTGRSVADGYAHEFEQMWGGRFGSTKRPSPVDTPREAGAPDVEVYFSPEGGAERRLLDLLAGARRSIRFMAFSYTSAPIADAMLARARAGVEVRGVVEARNADGTGSRFATLRDAGVDVLKDGNCYNMHHKVIIIDERIVVTGSYNFTGSAEHDNDENMVVIHDIAVAAAYLLEFERINAQAESPLRCL